MNFFKGTLFFFHILLCLFLISCASIEKRTDSDLEIYRKYVDCVYDSQSKYVKCSISSDEASFFTKKGKKLSVTADSGERIELWWKFNWLKLEFVLIYYNPSGTKQLRSGITIGRCLFSEGCNYGKFLGPDLDKNGIPDYFTEIIWDSWDFGADDDGDGYLDHYQYVFRPQENLYEVTNYKYFYPEKCTPPVSPWNNVCSIYSECKGPYVLKEKKILESKRF